MLSALFSSLSTNLCWCMFYFTANSLALPILQYPDIRSQPGPSGIQIFNPGIFGTGFTLIFNPGIVRKFFRDFCFYFLLPSLSILSSKSPVLRAILTHFQKKSHFQKVYLFLKSPHISKFWPIFKISTHSGENQANTSNVTMHPL